MPILEFDTANIYYEDTGAGEPIVLVHGFTANSSYWTKCGIAPRLAEQYRVISMDMRGHGRSVPTARPHGFNARTIADDIDALTKSLGLGRFHLLGHSTGGMVAVRYAMRRGERLNSLILLDTSSATALVPDHDPQTRRRYMEAFADQLKERSWEQIFSFFRQKPGPLLTGIDQHPDRERLWEIYEDVARINNPQALAAFARAFFWDPDPRRERLRLIPCPTLILVGELDSMFLEPSQLMAAEIPDAEYVAIECVGHMPPMEAPDRTLEEILTFLEGPAGSVPQAKEPENPPD